MYVLVCVAASGVVDDEYLSSVSVTAYFSCLRYTGYTHRERCIVSDLLECAGSTHLRAVGVQIRTSALGTFCFMNSLNPASPTTMYTCKNRQRSKNARCAPIYGLGETRHPKRANCNANTWVVGTPTGHDGEKAQAKHIDAEIIAEVELISSEVKPCQLSELPDLCRDGTCQRIFIIHTQNGRLVYQLQSREFLSTRTSQLILVKVKVCQLRELPDLCRDGTCQRIFMPNTQNGRLVYQLQSREFLSTRTSRKTKTKQKKKKKTRRQTARSTTQKRLNSAPYAARRTAVGTNL